MSSPLWHLAAKILGSGYTLYIVLIAYISNMIAGFSFAWSSPMLIKLNETEHNPLGMSITPDESDLIGSLFYVGAAIGPLLFIKSLESLGRKPTIVIMSLPLPIAYGILGVAGRVEVMYVCRVILGFVVGGICSTVPIYTSEIIPSNSRGSLMSLSNTFIQTGSLVTYVIGPYLSVLQFNSFIVVVSVVFLLLFSLSCPETPYYVMQNEGKSSVKVVLECLREGDVQEELEDIEVSVKKDVRSSYLDIFKSRNNIKAFSMATIILIIQQLTGINMVIGYSQLIFSKTDLKFSSAKCAIIVGGLQAASSFIAPVVSDKFPRKYMLYFSFLGLSICNFLMSTYFFVLEEEGVLNWLPLATLVVFVVMDNCGNGPLPWVLLGEIYPMQIKSVGPALSTSLYYVVQFLLTFSFNKIELKYMFSLYGCCCIFGVVYVRFFVTETGGKSLREIQESLGKEAGSTPEN